MNILNVQVVKSQEQTHESIEVSADLVFVLVTLLADVEDAAEFISVKLTQLPRRLPRCLGLASKSLSQGAESLLTKKRKYFSFLSNCVRYGNSSLSVCFDRHA